MHDTFEIHPVKGETTTLWIPLGLALIGTIISIITAQSIVPQDKMKPPKFDGLTHQPLPVAPVAIDSESDSESHPDSTPAAPEKNESRKIADCPPLFFFNFTKDSATPKAHDLTPQIKRFNNWLQQHPQTKIFIEGHTDSSGKAEYNLLLSYRRAKAVEKILIEAGIPEKQITARALGEQEPLQDYSAESEKNRRASVRVEALQECINPLINEK